MDTCKHPRKEERYKVIADGRRQYCLQCLDCRKHVWGPKGAWIPRPEDTSDIAEFDRYLETKQAELTDFFRND